MSFVITCVYIVVCTLTVILSALVGIVITGFGEEWPEISWLSSAILLGIFIAEALFRNGAI